MTTSSGSTTYAYNPAVDDFGNRLRLLRGALNLKNTVIAERALGEESTEDQRKDFANYLSRMQRGHKAAQNPGLSTLEMIAKGMDLTLWKFLLRIEGGTDADLHGVLESTTTRIPANIGRQNSSLSSDDHALLIRLSRIFVAAASATPAAREQDKKTRHRKPRRTGRP